MNYNEVFKKQPHRYFFLYGSLLNAEMQKHCEITPEPIVVARLNEYTLDFYGYSKIWDSGVETVVPAPGKTVWGVVYKLSHSDADSLDLWYDARLDGSGISFHYPVIVEDNCNNQYHAYMYKKDVLGKPEKPTIEYVKFIKDGAQREDLPGVYIGELCSISVKSASYQVPRESRFSKIALLKSTCSECGDLRISKGGTGL
jgi:gamma-glutamylcyclotransferase (GGCT)/AIG2-like uncharacterized protein YtfP